MSDKDKKDALVGEAQVREDVKPVERLTLKVEFATPMDSAALGELIEAVKCYGTVVEAKHAVLRRYSRELV